MTPDEAIAILNGAEAMVLNRNPDKFVEAINRAILALDSERQAIHKQEKGCVYCTSHQTLETDGGGELELVQLIPLPAINLTTGETEKNSAPPSHALLFQAFEGELEDFVPIRCCPMCGRVLKKGAKE